VNNARKIQLIEIDGVLASWKNFMDYRMLAGNLENVKKLRQG
jgi:hypothetical protein